MSKRRNLKQCVVIAVILFGLGCATAAGEVIYVDSGRPTSGTGQTWGTAYKYLQDALYKPPIGGDEIWVAQGIYKPDEDEGSNVTLNDQFATFQLLNSVALKGGYAGSGEPDPNARDVKLYETILSGDLNDDDVGDANNSENSYHVVTGSGTDATALLGGFTITAGNADVTSGSNDRGGGMYNNSGSPMVTNCTFSGNWAEQYGGGMCNDNSSPTVTNCAFNGNEANSGISRAGGMYNDSGSSVVTNCTFSGNTAKKGGGMYNTGSSSPTLTNCTFSENMADDGGGGIYNNSPSNLILTNCILWGNSDNGGMDESAQICNYIFTPDVNYCCIQGLTGGLSGTGNIGGDPLLRDANGLDDIPGTEDDNLRLLAGSSCIDAGNNDAVPLDTADLDGDSDTGEQTPWDIDGSLRFVDDPCTPDTGNGTAPIVDIGACERYRFCGGIDNPYPTGDMNQDCRVNFFDIAMLVNNWLQCTHPDCE